MFIQDVNRFRNLLKGVKTIDIASFGSVISPEYLIQLINFTAWNGRYAEKYGFIGASLPGAGWQGGLNTLLQGNNVDWVIGGYFGATRQINCSLALERGEVHNLPQGVLAKLMSEPNRQYSTNIGMGTFIDPSVKGSCISSGAPFNFMPVVNTGNFLTYTLPESDLVIMRGAGFTQSGDIVLETQPIDLDLESVIRCALSNQTKIAIQVPDRIVNDPEKVCSRDLFDEVFIAPDAFHIVSYLPGRYHLNDENLYRHCLDSASISHQLAQRITAHERLIIGIGLPVPAVNQVHQYTDCQFDALIESGVAGGVLYDGDGFGMSRGGKKRYTQNEIFQKIWNGEIDHAVLGLGEVDRLGRVNIAKLGETFFGVGGFIDISQSIQKITFCYRNKFETDQLERVCFTPRQHQDICYIRSHV
ncbi:propionate CoA-transferase [Photobacterium sp. WH24]|uniref:propionate CoA-transferase n=1 Tax=Photobacterium sp. WH24 TaxID=2827237 RepID=UPI001C486FFF|nr:propionate CoA-transferase [Photobacterium sp. WH24]